MVIDPNRTKAIMDRPGYQGQNQGFSGGYGSGPSVLSNSGYGPGNSIVSGPTVVYPPYYPQQQMGGMDQGSMFLLKSLMGNDGNFMKFFLDDDEDEVSGPPGPLGPVSSANVAPVKDVVATSSNVVSEPVVSVKQNVPESEPVASTNDVTNRTNDVVVTSSGVVSQPVVSEPVVPKEGGGTVETVETVEAETVGSSPTGPEPDPSVVDAVRKQRPTSYAQGDYVKGVHRDTHGVSKFTSATGSPAFEKPVEGATRMDLDFLEFGKPKRRRSKKKQKKRYSLKKRRGFGAIIRKADTKYTPNYECGIVEFSVIDSNGNTQKTGVYDVRKFEKDGFR